VYISLGFNSRFLSNVPEDSDERGKMEIRSARDNCYCTDDKEAERAMTTMATHNDNDIEIRMYGYVHGKLLTHAHGVRKSTCTFVEMWLELKFRRRSSPAGYKLLLYERSCAENTVPIWEATDGVLLFVRLWPDIYPRGHLSVQDFDKS